MSSYSVNYNNLRLQQANLKKMAQTIDKVGAAVSRQGSSIYRQDVNLRDHGNQALAYAKLIDQAGEKVLQLEKKLENIIAFYEQAEIKCISSFNGIPVNAKTLNELLKAPLKLVTFSASQGCILGNYLPKTVQKKANWFTKLGTSVISKTYNVGKVAVANWKSGVSVIKKNLEPGGKWYQYKMIGKSALGLSIGIVGTFASIVALGAGLAPVAGLGAMYSINKLQNSTRDMAYAWTGQYDKIGKENYLKDTLRDSSKKLTGSTSLGDIVYGAGDLVNATASIIKKTKEVAKALNGIKLSELPAEGRKVWGYLNEDLRKTVDFKFVKSTFHYVLNQKYYDKLMSYDLPSLTNVYDTYDNVKSVIGKVKKFYTYSDKATKYVLDN